VHHHAAWKIVGANTRTFEMCGTHGFSKAMQILEITYMRQS